MIHVRAVRLLIFSPLKNELHMVWPWTHVDYHTLFLIFTFPQTGP